MAGELTTAAAPLRPAPQGGGVAQDIATVLGGVMQKREADAEKRRQQAIQDAMLQLETARTQATVMQAQAEVGQVEVARETAARQAQQAQWDQVMDMARLQTEQERTGLEGRRVELAEVEAERSLEEKQAADAGAGDILQRRYGYTPEQIPKGTAVQTLAHLREVELRNTEGRYVGLNAIMEGMGKRLDVASQNRQYAEGRYQAALAAATKFRDSILSSPLILVDGVPQAATPEQQQERAQALEATLTVGPEGRMAAVKAAEAAALDLGVIQDFWATKDALEAAETDYMNTASYYTQQVDPIIQGYMGAPGLGAGAGGSPPPPPVPAIVAKAVETHVGALGALMGGDPQATDPEQFVNLWPIVDADWTNRLSQYGYANPVDSVLAEHGYPDRPTYLAAVVEPKAQEKEALRAQAQAAGAATPAPVTQVPGPGTWQGEVAPVPGAGAPAPQPPATRALEEFRGMIQRGKESRQPMSGQQMLPSALRLLHLGVPRDQILDAVGPKRGDSRDMMRKWLDERLPGRVGG